jgi:ATP-dependent helicase IRC3
MILQDRPFQDRAIEATLSEYDKGVRKMMLVMATGTGKTIVFSRLYEAMKSRLPGKMLIIAHRNELVQQNAEKAQSVNPTLKIGREDGTYRLDGDEDIISSSVQTLGRKGTQRLEQLNWEQIDKVVIDEAHHGVTDGYSRILERSGVLSNAPESKRLLLGVTATPTRPDGAALSDVFDKVAYVYGIRAAIEDGWLVDLRGYRVHTDTSLDGLPTSDGDFVKSDLSKAVNTPQRNAAIISTWLKHGEGRQTMAFTVDIAHAQALAESFRERGVLAEATWGEDPDRDLKKAALHDGRIQVLCNCNLYVEGFDDWRISCIILARPTESDVLYTQMVGRVTRLDPRTGNLKTFVMPKMAPSDWEILPIKTDGIIFDVTDNSSKHSLLTLPTLMGLSKDLDLKGASLLNTVQTLEMLQEDNPNVDFTKLDMLTNATLFIEQVNLFTVRFPKEVEENSELLWFRAIDGGFKMRIPKELGKPGWIRIYENALGKWDVVGQINEDDFHGTRNTLEETFKVADEQVRKRVHKLTLQKVLRTAAWHGKPLTRGQKSMLERLFPHKSFRYDLMTSGEASKLISERLARKK